MSPSPLLRLWFVAAGLALAVLVGCSHAVSPGADDAAPCPDGSFGEGAGSCTPWTVCAPGQFQSAPGSSTADAVCAPCAAESFSAEANATACRKWTACAPGSLRTMPGTATADARCEPCPAGSFSDKPDGASCPLWRDCPRGEYVASPASSTADRVCAPCPPGAFSAELNAGNCSPWTECAPGESVSMAGTNIDDQVCAACPSGTFSDQKNEASCSAWKDCKPGEYVANAATASADRVCTACPAGTFSTGKNATSCKAWTACVPGEYVAVAGSATSDQFCAACDLRTFTSTANAVDCQPWRSCRAGTYVANTPSRTADRDCQPCAAGTTSNVTNSPFCRSLCENGGVPVFTGGPTYVYDLAGDYSSGPRSLGPWSYGWSNPPSTAVNYTGSFYSDPSGIEGVLFQGSTGGGGAGVFKNVSGITLHPSNTTTVGPGGLWLHPGQSGQNAVALWSAPTAATWTVSAVFSGASGYNGSPLTTTDVSMTGKAGSLFSNYLNLGYRSAAGAFNLTRASTSLSMAYGDQVAVAVGYGNGDWGFDSTLVDLQVSTGFTCTCPLGTWGARCERKTVSLSANSNTTCALESDGTAACWPLGSAGVLFPYGVYKQVEGDGDRGCGLLTDGSMLCFGTTSWPSTTPAFPGKYLQVDMNSQGWTCALKTDGTVPCYPANYSPTGTFSSIAVGSLFGCGVRPDGSLACWDMGASLGAPAPSGTDFTAVAVSSHACALRKNGTVVCWGGSTAVQSQTIPPDVFTQITLGTSHACGLKPGGTILCWGDNYQGKTNAPAGVFVSIAAGANHTCAVRANGQVVCWGENAAGQLSTLPPTACGACAVPQSCGGGGTPGVCGCTPTSCTAQKKDCGTIPDGCGGTLTCGSCTAPSTCGGGGTANVCGCTKVSCADFGFECGTMSDGCGQPLNCGQCNASLGQVCRNHFCVTIVPD